MYRRQSIPNLGGDSTQPIKVTKEEILAQFSASMKRKMDRKPADTLSNHLLDYTDEILGTKYLQQHGNIEEQDTFSLGTF